MITPHHCWSDPAKKTGQTNLHIRGSQRRSSLNGGDRGTPNIVQDGCRRHRCITPLKTRYGRSLIRDGKRRNQTRNGGGGPKHILTKFSVLRGQPREGCL